MNAYYERWRKRQGEIEHNLSRLEALLREISVSLARVPRELG